jgi:CheY-like chemotaxis protein
MQDQTTSHPRNHDNLEDWSVLVVDDQHENLELTAAILRSRGAEVTLVDNAKDALDILRDYNVTVVLLDLAMPEMDGWQMVRVIRENKATSHIPVIAFSVRLSLEDEQKAKDAGFDGYISKPFSIALLIERMKVIVDTVNH